MNTEQLCYSLKGHMRKIDILHSGYKLLTNLSNLISKKHTMKIIVNLHSFRKPCRIGLTKLLFHKKQHY